VVDYKETELVTARRAVSLSCLWQTRVENLPLRDRHSVLFSSFNQRKLDGPDRLLWASLYGVWRDWPSAFGIVKIATVIA